MLKYPVHPFEIKFEITLPTKEYKNNPLQSIMIDKFVHKPWK